MSENPTILEAFIFLTGVLFWAAVFLAVLFGMVVATTHQLKRRRIRKVWSAR